jgi:hypothetical protein
MFEFAEGLGRFEARGRRASLLAEPESQGSSRGGLALGIARN